MILLRSEIFDWTRFPVSDGAGIKGGAHCRYFLFLLCVSEIKNIFHFLDFFVFSGRSEIFDLTRFPVSDGAEIKCCTFCTILDRKHFLKFFSSHYSEKCELFGISMEMSGIGC